MKNHFGAKDIKKYIPTPVFDGHPEYTELYNKAWQLAFEHIKDIPGMPQTPYMDEAFCETQLWIWDSCFMSLFCKYARDVFPGVETLNNFYKVLYENGTLPYIIPPENEPEWTGAVPGKPYEIKVHIADNPPLFAWAEYENALMLGDRDYIKELLYNRKVLQKHYAWIEGLKSSVKPAGVLNPTCLISCELGYKWEGGRSGMDNTPRGRTGGSAVKERPNNPDMLWIDAVCQQALTAKTIARLYSLLGDKKHEEEWNKKHGEKAALINRYYWDPEDGFYYDIDCNTKELYKVKTVASFWALTSETATKERADILVKHISNPETFGGTVPLLSLARNDADYSENGKYWRGALWLPTAYAALKGMAAYGYFEDAHKAALKIVEHMYKTYRNCEPHTIWECYSPEKCEPAAAADGKKTVRKDFCGWSALGPISVFIEFVLGFYKTDAFEKTVKWALPAEYKGNIGIKGLRFGSTVTDIIADKENCYVTSNEDYTLEINGKSFKISAGDNTFKLP